MSKFITTETLISSCNQGFIYQNFLSRLMFIFLYICIRTAACIVDDVRQHSISWGWWDNCTESRRLACRRYDCYSFYWQASLSEREWTKTNIRCKYSVVFGSCLWVKMQNVLRYQQFFSVQNFGPLIALQCHCARACGQLWLGTLKKQAVLLVESHIGVFNLSN